VRHDAMHSGILLDSSFLIRLTNGADALHLTAKAYFDAATKLKIPMHLSTLVVAEFEVNQELPAELRNAMIPTPFDYIDGKRAALFQKVIGGRYPDDNRTALRIDTLLMAQAHMRKLGAILTNDRKTLAKYLSRLRDEQKTEVHAILLSDGFEENRLKNPSQSSLQLPLPGS
jgi:predicted nucleic acid-binding protein